MLITPLQLVDEPLEFSEVIPQGQLDYAPDVGWHGPRIVPYGPVALDPAAWASVFKLLSWAALASKY